MEERLRGHLDRRMREGTLRSLLPLPKAASGDDPSACSGGGTLEQRVAKPPRPTAGPSLPLPPSVDFSSNDYLGLARCPYQLRRVTSEYESLFLGRDDSDDDDSPSHSSIVPAEALGATGSRLLSGDSALARSLEYRLADLHGRPAALLFNSGYDANLSVLSSVPLPGDVLIMDELSHNSLIMGARMSRLGRGSARTFRHNNVDDLERELQRARMEMTASATTVKEGGKGDEYGSDEREIADEWTPRVLIAVESVYSMDGDVAPLRDILDLAARYGASVVVDEAHGLGVYGRTNVSDLELPERRPESDPPAASFPCDKTERIFTPTASEGTVWGVRTRRRGLGGTGVLAALDLESHSALLCSVHTFGKAAGCHGAVVAASGTVVDYLVNYARPFVYSTAPPPHSLVAIRCAYDAMTGEEGERRRRRTFELVELFRRTMISSLGPEVDGEIGDGDKDGNRINSLLLPSPSPIQAVLVPGNQRCVALAERLQSAGGFHLYPIRSPTVPRGKERIRIILHAHNTEGEVLGLVRMLVEHARSSRLTPSAHQHLVLSRL